MTNNYANAREAQAGAMQIRKQIGASFDQPLAILDAAIELKILVKLMDISTMEGIWCKEKRAIFLTTRRPPGRRAFTCAHEMAHFHFNHGTHVDELMNLKASADEAPEEFLANQFAGYLLMPPFAVPSALKVRGLSADSLTPEQAYRLACFFGVSYTGLLNHMHYALKVLKRPAYARLEPVTTKSIRGFLCPGVNVSNLVVVDELWKDRPVDLDVEHAVLLPHGTECTCDLLERVACPQAPGMVCIAREPGVGTLTLPPHGQELLVRVMSAEFDGFAENRFPEKNNVYHTS